MHTRWLLAKSIALACGCAVLPAQVWAAGESVPAPAQAAITLPLALEMTLQHSPNITLEKLAVDVAKASARMASGAFNLVGRMGITHNHSDITALDVDGLKPADRARLPPNAANIEVGLENNQVSAGLTQPFRSGLSADLSVAASLTDPDILLHPLQLPTNKGMVSFTLTVPLLKGAGTESAGAAETAAKLNHQASVADFQHSISSTILETITAFWNYSSARWYADQVQASQARVQKWIERAGRSDKTLDGYLEDKKGKWIDATQTLSEARVALATKMGITPDQLAAMGEPVDEFPLEWGDALSQFDSARMQQQWTQLALDKRLDLKAARLRQESAQTNLKKARKDTLPKLDVTLSVGYNGFTQYNGLSQLLDSTYRNVGVNYGAGLTLNYPFGNDVAEGALDLSQVDYRQKTITAEEKVRALSLGVMGEVSSVHGRMQKAVQIRKTLLSYRDALTTLLDDKAVLEDLSKLITAMQLEDKYLEAQSEGARALTDLASAIAKARFTTGTLLTTDEAGGQVHLADLATLP